MSLACYYALGGLNYKNGFVTSCPQQSDKLAILDDKYLPSEVFNSKHFLQHRKDLMSDIWPKGCDMCMHVENDKSGTSMRQELSCSTKHYNNDGTVSFEGLKTIELRFSHACNMSCLHCSMVYSSGWLTKLKRYTPDDSDYKHKLLQLTGQMHRDNDTDDLTISMSTERALEIVDDLIKNFPNLERIDFAGGEVLYQKPFLPVLEALAEHPNAKNIQIVFHTNFNTDFDPVRLSNALSKFGGKITIMISVDAGPRIYPYFRQGNWEKLKSNMTAFREADNGKCELNIVCTTGTYQIMEIEDAYTGFLTLDANWINSSIIYTPDYLNPAIMMQHFSDEVILDIDNAIQSVLQHEKSRKQNLDYSVKLHSYRPQPGNNHSWTDIYSAYESLKKTKQYITAHKTDPSHWDAFKAYITKTDKIWKQDFNKHIQNYKFVDGEIVRNV